jgi:hypothetical protein
MTTPTGFSPNIRILPKEGSLPADAPKSQTPLAEAALAELLQGGRLGIRDMYKPVDALPEILTEQARAEWEALAEDIGTGYTSARMLLEDWWRHGWSQTFSQPAFWSAPVTPPAPEAHPYPGPALAAEPEPPLTAAALEPLPGLKSSELPLVPPAEPEPAAGEAEDATKALEVLTGMAKPEAEDEPDDATTVMPATDKHTEVFDAVKDGGESDAS